MSNKPVPLGWVKHGPSGSEGTIGWLVGTVVWWRLWAFLGLMYIPLGVGLWALEAAGPGFAVMITWMVGWLTASKALSVSPKYTVEENY